MNNCSISFALSDDAASEPKLNNRISNTSWCGIHVKTIKKELKKLHYEKINKQRQTTKMPNRTKRNRILAPDYTKHSPQ